MKQTLCISVLWVAAGLSACQTALHRPAAPVVLVEASGEKALRAAILAAVQRDDYAEAARSLTALARQYPESPSGLRDDYVGHIVYGSKKLADPQVYVQVIDALFDAHYVLDYGNEPSFYWADLSLAKWDQGDHAKAIEVFGHVTDPYDLIWIQTDHRFAGLRSQLPGAIDVDAATLWQLRHWQELANAHPDQLEPLYILATLLMEIVRPEDTLDLADQIIARIEAADKKSPAYTDMDEWYIWLLNERGRALFHLHRYDEAFETMKGAAERSEQGSPNVSQRINLAGEYNALGRSKEALAQLDAVSNASAFGGMQVESERFRAALAMGDSVAAGKALSYLEAHQADSPSTYELALLSANRLDEAEALLIKRLADPVLRQNALLAVQIYMDDSVTPRDSEELLRWRAVVARPKVKAAIAQVGSVGIFNIAQRAF
jgi:beta-barrel assembly-enhancing protease